MKIKYYLLLLLLITPVILLFYIHPTESMVLLPNTVEEYTVKATGQNLEITTTNQVQLNISEITPEDVILMEEVSLPGGGSFKMTLEESKVLLLSFLSNTVNEISLSITGIPNVVMIYLVVLTFLNILAFRTDIMKRLR